MASNPYVGLPQSSYWSSGVARAATPVPAGLYRKKWPIVNDENIATAGSCFAQHIGRNLRKNGFTVMDVEPPPRELQAADQGAFGYSIYSARYGNIYTVRQLLQLAREAFGQFEPADIAWRNQGGKFFDALRPGVEPEGLDSIEEVMLHRRYHLDRVRHMFSNMNLFIFTMGLTECWEHRSSGTVYPTAPGTIAGIYDPEQYVFKNFRLQEIIDDFLQFRRLIHLMCPEDKPRFLLTVSPVPLTATATDQHVLLATMYSKSVLRSAAGDLAADHEDIDYFPSFEIITSPWGGQNHYEKNMRSVRASSVDQVMKTFFDEHGSTQAQSASGSLAPQGEQLKAVADAQGDLEPIDDVVCEEAMLDAFAKS